MLGTNICIMGLKGLKALGIGMISFDSEELDSVGFNCLSNQ
jgi:hypothetical protein